MVWRDGLVLVLKNFPLQISFSTLSLSTKILTVMLLNKTISVTAIYMFKKITEGNYRHFKIVKWKINGAR